MWDEIPPTHRFCVEALNRTLHDFNLHQSPIGRESYLAVWGLVTT